MSTQIKVPELDQEKLQQAANEFAMKGALETIKNYYTAWDSPYKKGIEESLKNKSMNIFFDLPDVLSVINEQLTKEIDQIANTAVLNTYIPMVKEFLVRVEGEIKFSDLLKEFVCLTDNRPEHAYSIDISESEYKWLDVTLKCLDKKYALTFHTAQDGKYEILNLPFNYKNSARLTEYMEINSNNVNVKLPFTREVLSDRFVSFVARMIIAKTSIEMDVDDFPEEIFSED